MLEQTCPGPAELSGFVLGTLPLRDLDRVARHLDACPVCEAAVNSLERISDPLVAAIRDSGVGSNGLKGHSVASAGPLVPERLGDFRIIREIGRGGMGFVYEAEQVSLGRRVALKVLPRHALLDPESVERFRRESRTVAGLHHTNIVQIFGTGEHDGLHYFVMELIGGVGLDRVMRELKQTRAAYQPEPTIGRAAAPEDSRKPVSMTTRQAASLDPSIMAVVRGLLSGTSAGSGPGTSANRDGLPAQQPDAPAEPPASPSSSGSGRPYWIRVARVGMQIAEALAHAHAYGVVHRDIKPSNLLLDYRGTVWVTDFGLAKAADEEQVLTRSGDIIGTLRYLPPERLDGKSDTRGEVYSLGVTLYELVTLRDAFPEVDRSVLLRRKLNAELPRPRRVNPNIPRDLETIIVKAIAREPSHRYQAAADLAADLRRFVEDRPVRARRVTPPERLWRWCRRDPRTASLLGSLLLALTAGLVGVAIEWRRAEKKARDEAAAHRRADLAQEQARADLYLSNIAQARLEWRLNNVARAGQLLDHCEQERRGWEWHYLRGVNRPELASLSNNELSMIFGVAFEPTGRYVAFTGWNYYGNTDGHAPTPVEVWDFARGQKLHTLSAPGVGLRPAFSSDGRLLAVSGSWTPVSLWDSATGKLVRTLEEKGDATFSPDGRLLAVAGPTAITMHDVASGRLVRRFASRAGRVRFSPDGKLLARSAARAVELLSATTGEELARLPHAQGDQVDLFFPELGPEIAFDPDGKRLVTATSPPRVWDVATRRPLFVLGGHAGIVPGVAFGPDGRWIATAGADGTVRLWDAQTGAELAVLRGHAGIVSCVAFHPEGRALISGGRQPGVVKIWDLTRPVEFGVLSGGGAWALAFDENDRLKRVNHSGLIETHEPETGRIELGRRVDLIQKWMSPASMAAFSGDSRLLAAVSSDMLSVKVFEASTGREIAHLHGLEAPPRRLAMSQDGRRVAAATARGADGTARQVLVWDTLSGQVLAEYRPGGSARAGHLCGSVALSPDGRLVAFDDEQAADVDGPNVRAATQVRVCDLTSAKELLAAPAADEGIGCLAFSPDGLLVAAAGADGRVLVWETATGPVRCDDHLELSPLGLAFSPDSRRLAAVNREVVTIWDMETGKGILTLRGSPPRPLDLASNAAVTWSRDGRWLAAVNWDGTVAIWDGDANDRPMEPGWFRHVPPARVYAWHLDQAEAARTAGQWAAAVFHLDRVSAVEPPDLAMRHQRGRLHFLRGDWTRAGADYAALFAATEPDQATAWLNLARLLLLQHDHDGYCRLVPRMIAQCGGRSDLGNPEPDEARASVLAPGGTDNPTGLVNFASRVWNDKQGAESILWSLALAHYRAGQYERARARADEALARQPDLAWLSWPVLALVHAKLGHTDEARRWLAQAHNWHEQERRRQVTESAGFAAPHWADFEIIYREAAAAIGGGERIGAAQ